MRKENVVTLPSLVVQKVINRSAAMNVLLVVTGSFLLAVSAQVQIPVLPVPWTLQPLALLLIGASLGLTRGASAAALYLLEGLAGFPVFAGGASGLHIFMGPTAGYLYAFPAAAAVAGYISERGWGTSFFRTLLGMALALGLVYLGGWSWLAGMFSLGARGAFDVGVAPFLLADVVKLATAAAILPLVQRFLERTHA
jgi:biotin transport system substrate-specific component